ncbi:MAG: hypothetical protein LBK92_02800 [Endomicrobium sp.]|nr:hypothetical protein [Endomicrobium sp.]
MYIITEDGLNCKERTYNNKDILMFDTSSDYKCGVHLANGDYIIAKKILKLETLFESK